MFKLNKAVSILVVLAFLACLSNQFEIKVYNEHEFAMFLPEATAITYQYVDPTLDDSKVQYSISTRDGVIRGTGEAISMVKGSKINYTIKYDYEHGTHQVSGIYVFDGVYYPNEED